MRDGVSLEGQRALLIAPRFFGYEAEIREELERRGASVDFILDRPFESALMKALARFARAWVMPVADRYVRAALAEAGTDAYDLILVINGQTLSRRVVSEMRRAYPGAQLILYLWDSARNRSSSVAMTDLFDRVLTFDPMDARTFGMSFRPLFYGRGFAIAGVEPPDIDLSFIGTVHTDRYAIASRVVRQLPPGRRAWTYFYLQAPWVFWVQKLTNRSFSDARMNEFKFAPLPASTVQDIFRRSLAVLDIEHPQQTGLTMRTLEALGARKKFITTNAGILEYEFYSPENILLIDRSDPRLPASFLETPYRPLEDAVYYRYSIAGWLDDVIGEGVRK